MSDVRPFAALRYTRAQEPRLAGPYDVISPEDRERLAREPENIVHLTLPPGSEGERDYAGAAATLERWRFEGVLRRDASEQLYLLEECTPEGRVRRGFLALLRLADYDEGVVLPHEHTMPGPKLDRLLLTRAVRANLEPLFFLYEDRDAKLDPVIEQVLREEPLTRATGPDGTALSLRGVAAPEPIEAVRSFLAGRPVIIADGHHRYETMLSYRDECRLETGDGDAPHEFVLAYLVNAFDPGSEIRAIHRVLRRPERELEPVLAAAGLRAQPLAAGADAAALLATLAERSEQEDAFVFARTSREPLLATRARGKPLAVEVLHEELLPPLGGELGFDARPDRLLETVGSGGAEIGILLHPIAPDALFRVVRGGARLPRKSTFFTPKVPSGVVIREL